MQLKELLTAVTLCHLISCSFEYNGTQLIKEIGRIYCPYTDFCKTEASKILPNSSVQPCCLPCFCDDACWELDNCCPDKDKICPYPVVLPCKAAEVKRNLRRKDDATFGYFRVVDFCPPSEVNETLSNKCRGDNRTKVEEYIWVSERNSGRIFQNRYCADCHGVSNVIKWQIITTCKDIFEANLNNAVDIIWSPYCNIINVIPEKHRNLAPKYACYDPILSYSECDEVTLGENFDLDVVTACERNSWPLMVETLVTTFYYNNVFCGFCNLPSTDRIKELCKPVTRPKGELSSFRIFIDFLNDASVDQAPDAHRCRINEIEDKYFEQCRELTCPTGEASVYGTCEPMVANFSRFCLAVNFYMEILWNRTSLFSRNSQTSVSLTHGTEIHAQIREHIGLETTDCILYSSQLFMFKNFTSKSNYLSTMLVKLSSGCPIEFLRRKVNEMVGKSCTVEIYETGVLEMMVSIAVKIDTDGLHSKTIFIDDYSNPNAKILDISCYYQIRHETDRECATIELKQNEAELFTEKQNEEKSTYLSFFETAKTTSETSSVFVCLEDYLTMMLITGSGNYLQAIPVNVLVTCIGIILND